MINTPVLFLGFNRQDLASTVLERLRECGVKRLYVALDGPRSGNASDLELCTSMKALIDEIDWADEKVVLERSENLGCGRAVSSAISWFFEHVDHGIIVEDDCLPDPTFFAFCEEMLIRYENKQDVWSVAGTSLIPDHLKSSQSHFFSKYSGIWGWATWRRAWETYSYDLSCLNARDWSEVVDQECDNPVERRYWLHILEMMLKGQIDTWDFQVQFCSWRANAVHVTSSVNLVQNLGFRSDATHTINSSSLADRSVRGNLPPYAELPVIADKVMDRIVFGERLHASKELAEWLFGQNTLNNLFLTAEKQSNYIKELEDHMGKRASIISELESVRKIQAEEIVALEKKLGKYHGISGALRCIKQKK